MKKKILFLLLVITIFILGCGKSQQANSLDYKSILYTKDNIKISIGDTKKSIDKLFGDGIYNDKLDMYKYCDGGIQVEYLEGLVVYIETDSDNFETLNFKPAMDESSIAEDYTRSGSDSLAYYEIYYDSKGNRCSEDVAVYSCAIMYKDGVYDGLYLSLN